MTCTEESRSEKDGSDILPMGTGRSIAHHGEYLQGVFHDQGGQIVQGLISLPLFGRGCVARFTPQPGQTIVTIPDGKTKAMRAARLMLDTVGLRDWGGQLHIDSDIPEGFGLGSSTADILAVLRAVAVALRQPLSRRALSLLCVETEQASDPLAYDMQPVLFAQRRGCVLDYLPGEYPPMYVLSCRSPDDPPVNTLDLDPARYTLADMNRFQALRALSHFAFSTANAEALGHLATQSALINQRFRPKAQLNDCLAIAMETGACGIQVAHSGNVIGVLFEPRAGVEARLDLAQQRLDASGLIDLVRFAVNVDQSEFVSC